VARDKDDPKNLLKCPNCGLTLDFTVPLVKCETCRALLCGGCVWRYKEHRFCKHCHRKHAALANKQEKKK
jgi:hypothetical protein